MLIDPDKLFLIIIGLIISIISYYIKRESSKLQELGKELRSLQNELTKNTCKDTERWYWISKHLEDRREDCRKLYDLVNKK